MNLKVLNFLITKQDLKLIKAYLNNGQMIYEKASAIAFIIGKYTRHSLNDVYLKRIGYIGAKKIDKWCEVFENDELSILVLEQILNTSYFSGQEIKGYIVKRSDLYNALYDHFHIKKNEYIFSKVNNAGKLTNGQEFSNLINFFKEENLPKYCAIALQYLCLEKNLDFFETEFATKNFKIVRGDAGLNRYNVDVIFYFGFINYKRLNQIHSDRTNGKSVHRRKWLTEKKKGKVSEEVEENYKYNADELELAELCNKTFRYFLHLFKKGPLTLIQNEYSDNVEEINQISEYYSTLRRYKKEMSIDEELTFLINFVSIIQLCLYKINCLEENCFGAVSALDKIISEKVREKINKKDASYATNMYTSSKQYNVDRNMRRIAFNNFKEIINGKYDADNKIIESSTQYFENLFKTEDKNTFYYLDFLLRESIKDDDYALRIWEKIDNLTIKKMWIVKSLLEYILEKKGEKKVFKKINPCIKDATFLKHVKFIADEDKTYIKRLSYFKKYGFGSYLEKYYRNNLSDGRIRGIDIALNEYRIKIINSSKLVSTIESTESYLRNKF